MKLQYPFLQLPLSYDASALAAEIEALGESVWRPHPQGFPGNSALPLIAANGDAGNDDVRGHMQPTPHLEKLPYLREVLGSLGAVFGRSRLMRLSARQKSRLTSTSTITGEITSACTYPSSRSPK